MRLAKPVALVAAGVVLGGAVAVGATNLADFDAGEGTTLCSNDRSGIVMRPTGEACPRGSSPFVVANQDQVDAIEAAHNAVEDRVAALEAAELLFRCRLELAVAGLQEPGDANYVVGTDGDDDFSSQMTTGNDVVCGFAGNDTIFGHEAQQGLRTNDIFLGGDGNDSVEVLLGGTFNGGNGNDSVRDMLGGTFNGGNGNDSMWILEGGTFNGGDGDDSVSFMNLGTFNGGAGNDSVFSMDGGTFNGEGGCDSVNLSRGGTFDPGDESGCP